MKNILLAIAGLSPQVITETLYALHQEGAAIDEIHVIATRIGRDAITTQLLTPDDGRYFRYLKDYGLDPRSVIFSQDTLHVLRDGKGNSINDITSEEENEILLRTCLTLAHRFTKKPENTVFFSIAGGRKTMSACLMVAAQMFARPQDRIYHVLVSPEFESHKDFYYPPVKSVMLELRDPNGQKMFKDTAYAKITLVPIPFISLRQAASGGKTGRVRTPAELFRYLVREKKSFLTIDLTQGKIIYKKTELTMMPSRLALYAFFAARKLDCRLVRPDCRDCAECYADYRQISDEQGAITDFYRRLGGATEDKGICALEKDTLRAYVSKIRKDLMKAFGAQAAAKLAIEAVGRKPDTRYGIALERESIRLVE
ncbi:MAG: CRISPR-associated ring nuclease Csm6, partial [Smithellaceae bacterium]|nr:CRISPR-associated ring nuclease Csm6 [Smithellaceae bacterium]